MKSLSELLHDWHQVKDAYAKLKADAPRIAGDVAVKVFQLNIRIKHGFDTGSGVIEWDKRKKSTDAAYDRGRQKMKSGKLSKYRTGKSKTYKGSRYNSANPLLYQTHELYNSLAHVEEGDTTYVGANTNQVSYGKIKGLNEGTPNMVARKIIGFSKLIIDVFNMQMRSRRAQIFNKFKI